MRNTRMDSRTAPFTLSALDSISRSQLLSAKLTSCSAFKFQLSFFSSRRSIGKHLNGQRGHEKRTSGRQNGTGFPGNGLGLHRRLIRWRRSPPQRPAKTVEPRMTRMDANPNLVGTLCCAGPCGRPLVGTSRCDVPAVAFPVWASGISEPPAGNGEARAGTAPAVRPYQARHRWPSAKTAAGATVAQASAPAGGGSVSLPVQGRATTRGGTPLVGTSRCDVRRPGRAAGRRDVRRLVGKMKAVWSADVPGFRRLTLRSATGTAQRAIPTDKDIGLTAVAPKRRYVAARRRKVRPISDPGNGHESSGGTIQRATWL